MFIVHKIQYFKQCYAGIINTLASVTVSAFLADSLLILTGQLLLIAGWQIYLCEPTTDQFLDV